VIVAIYVPLAVAVLVGVVAPVVARWAHAAAGAVALAVATAVARAGTVWALLLLTATLFDELPDSDGVRASVPDVVAVAAAVWCVVAGIRVRRAVSGRRRLHRRLRDSLADLDGAAGDVVVVADPRPEAFAVPAQGRHGSRIVITEGMMRALGPRQRLALFAHERAHLEAGHDRLSTIAEIAAAVNPALVWARRSVAHLCERAADERAVARVGDRALVASAVATAALAMSGGTDRAVRPGLLAFGGLGVVQRVAALHRPARTDRRLVVAAAVLAGVLIIIADLEATMDFIRFARALLAS